MSFPRSNAPGSPRKRGRPGLWWHGTPPICWQWSRVRLCVRVCVKGGQGLQVGRWCVFVCVGGWFACVGVYMCAQVVNVYVVRLCGHVFNLYVWDGCVCVCAVGCLWVCVAIVCMCAVCACVCVRPWCWWWVGWVVGVVWKRIGKRIGIGAKNESKTDSQMVKKARISAVLIKSLDNPFNL